MPKPLSKEQKKRETDRNHSAMFRVFCCDNATEEDRTRAREGIQSFCKINAAESLGGLDGLIDLVRRSGKREVYLAWNESLMRGREIVASGGWDTVAEGGNE